MAKEPKIALVHDYLNQVGGAEKTLEILADIYPNADIYTSTFNKANFPKLAGRQVYTPKAGGLLSVFPILGKYFTFLLPTIFESFDLSHYDIVMSDSSAYAKGVITNANQLHISYIHTPPRFLYKYSVESNVRNKWYYRGIVSLVDNYLRIWDYVAAQRADYTLCNSNEIKRRIKKFYGIDANVIYPPVEMASIEEKLATSMEVDINNYYVIAGRLESYKNFDKVIEAFKVLTHLKLIVIGTGKQEKYLKSIASSNIKFVGRISDVEKNKYMHNCLGLINAVQDEDFGIVPIEVQAHGRPVLAHRSAGHLETVTENVTGLYFDKLDVESMVKKVREFDNMIRNNKFDAEQIRQSVQKFSKENFVRDIKAFVEKVWEEKNA